MLDVTFPELHVRVLVHQAVVNELKAFRQLNPHDVEGCGTLLGKVYESAIEIIGFTPPQATDKRARCGYVRHRAGHLEMATLVWKKSGGLESYVGEWHTHPELRPTPSTKDINEGRKIARDNRQNLVAIILGTSVGCIYMVAPTLVTEPYYFIL